MINTLKLIKKRGNTYFKDGYTNIPLILEQLHYDAFLTTQEMLSSKLYFSDNCTIKSRLAMRGDWKKIYDWCDYRINQKR